MGKSSSDLNRWFNGKILEVKVIRPDTNLQQIQLTCAGWGERLKCRTTKIKRFQDKDDATGLVLDDTDTTARVSEIVKDIIEDTDHYLDDGLGTETGITVTGVQTIDIKLADFQQVGQTWASAISQLATYGNAYWGLDQDRDLYFHTPMTQDGGFLFTNNLAGADAVGWDSKKLGFLNRTPVEWVDTTFGAGISILHGLGANVHTLVVDRNPTPNSTFNFKDNYLAIEFVPNCDNIEKISCSFNKNGTPANAGDMTIFLCGEDRDASGKPSLGNNLRAKGTLHSTKLGDIASSGRSWHEIGFNTVGGVPVAPNDKLYLVFKKFGDATDNIVIERDTAGTENFFTSAGGVDGTWSAAATDGFLMRVWTNNTIDITLENTSSVKKYGKREVVFSFGQNVQEETAREALIAVSDVLGKEKRTYSQVFVTPVTDKIPLGKKCRIQDSTSGLDTEADVVAVDVAMRADDNTNLGARNLVLTLEESHF